MNSKLKPLAIIPALAFALVVGACGGREGSAEKEKARAESSHDNDHDHGDGHDHDHDHDHGDGHDHGHAHNPPHGGTMVELGDHAAHAELVFDAGEGKVTLYLLDSSAEGAARSADQEIPLALTFSVENAEQVFEAPLKPVESSLTGEKAGDASEFSSANPAWAGKVLRKAEILKVNLKGQTYERVMIEIGAEPR